MVELCELAQELQLEIVTLTNEYEQSHVILFFLNFVFLFCQGNVKKSSTSLMYTYFTRFLPSNLHCGTQHQSFECLGLSILLWKTYLQLRQALLTKQEVVVPAVYDNPCDQCTKISLEWKWLENTVLF